MWHMTIWNLQFLPLVRTVNTGRVPGGLSGSTACLFTFVTCCATNAISTWLYPKWFDNIPIFWMYGKHTTRFVSCSYLVSFAFGWLELSLSVGNCWDLPRLYICTHRSSFVSALMQRLESLGGTHTTHITSWVMPAHSQHLLLEDCEDPWIGRQL